MINGVKEYIQSNNGHQYEPAPYQPTPNTLNRFFLDKTVEKGRFSVDIETMPNRLFKVSCLDQNHFSIFYTQLGVVTKGKVSTDYENKGSNFVTLDQLSYWDDVIKTIDSNNLHVTSDVNQSNPASCQSQSLKPKYPFIYETESGKKSSFFINIKQIEGEKYKVSCFKLENLNMFYDQLPLQIRKECKKEEDGKSIILSREEHLKAFNDLISSNNQVKK